MSQYPNAFYRVSAKALINNSRGHILVCKENSDHWSLPGGGVDHGEEPKAALVRELQEELGITSEIKIDHLVAVLPFFVSEHDRYQMWLVYATVVNEADIKVGQASTFAFMPRETFKDSTSRSEQLVYKAATS